MQVQAIAKNIRISPRKVRLVADAIRNMGVVEAMHILKAAQKQAAKPLAKTLYSAVANATHNAKLDSAHLFISNIQVNQGQALKRFRPSTRGRVHPYKKRGSTISIVLAEKVVAKPVAKEEVKAKTVKEKGGKK